MYNGVHIFASASHYSYLLTYIFSSNQLNNCWKPIHSSWLHS